MRPELSCLVCCRDLCCQRRAVLPCVAPGHAHPHAAHAEHAFGMVWAWAAEARLEAEALRRENRALLSNPHLLVGAECILDAR
jgi:hypothetical protein